MVDYSKKTVAELQEVLKSRSLPHTGKKAELVARLNEADREAEQAAPVVDSTPAPAQSAPAPEKEAEPTPVTAPEAVEPSAPQPSEDAAASENASTDAALANSAHYALNLPTSEVDAEMAKRKARAARFGTGQAEEGDTADAEALKNLERAKRFGTGQTAIGKLDEALSGEGRPPRRGRGEEDKGAMDDPGLRRGFGRGRGGRFRGKGGRDNSRRRSDKPTGVVKSSAFTSEADRLAAEARRKKFASAS